MSGVPGPPGPTGSSLPSGLFSGAKYISGLETVDVNATLAVPLDVQLWDTDAYWNSGHHTYFTAPFTAKYHVGCWVSSSGTVSSGQAQVTLLVNNVTQIARATMAAYPGGIFDHQLHVEHKFGAGDTVGITYLNACDVTVTIENSAMWMSKIAGSY